MLGTHFIYTDRVTEQSILLDETMKTWLMELDANQREIIVDAVFDILEELNIRTVDDLTRIKLKDVQEALKIKKSLPEETQQLLSEAVRLLFKTGNNTVRHYMKEKIEAYNSKK